MPGGGANSDAEHLQWLHFQTTTGDDCTADGVDVSGPYPYTLTSSKDGGKITTKLVYDVTNGDHMDKRVNWSHAAGLELTLGKDQVITGDVKLGSFFMESEGKVVLTLPIATEECKEEAAPGGSNTTIKFWKHTFTADEQAKLTNVTAYGWTGDNGASLAFSNLMIDMGDKLYLNYVWASENRVAPLSPLTASDFLPGGSQSLPGGSQSLQVTITDQTTGNDQTGSTLFDFNSKALQALVSDQKLHISVEGEALELEVKDDNGNTTVQSKPGSKFQISGTQPLRCQVSIGEHTFTPDANNPTPYDGITIPAQSWTFEAKVDVPSTNHTLDWSTNQPTAVNQGTKLKTVLEAEDLLTNYSNVVNLNPAKLEYHICTVLEWQKQTDPNITSPNYIANATYEENTPIDLANYTFCTKDEITPTAKTGYSATQEQLKKGVWIVAHYLGDDAMDETTTEEPICFTLNSSKKAMLKWDSMKNLFIAYKGQKLSDVLPQVTIIDAPENAQVEYFTIANSGDVTGTAITPSEKTAGTSTGYTDNNTTVMIKAKIAAATGWQEGVTNNAVTIAISDKYPQTITWTAAQTVAGGSDVSAVQTATAKYNNGTSDLTGGTINYIDGTRPMVQTPLQALDINTDNSGNPKALADCKFPAAGFDDQSFEIVAAAEADNSATYATASASRTFTVKGTAVKYQVVKAAGAKLETGKQYTKAELTALASFQDDAGAALTEQPPLKININGQEVTDNWTAPEEDGNVVIEYETGTYHPTDENKKYRLQRTQLTFTASAHVPELTIEAAGEATSVTAGQTLQLTAKLDGADVPNGTTLTWTSDKQTNATVSTTGLVTGQAVTTGDEVVTITVSATGCTDGTIELTVTAAEDPSQPTTNVLTIEAAGEATSVTAGQTLQLTAKLNNAAVPSTTTLTWASDKQANATVNATTGLVTGVAATTGTEKVTITVSANGCTNGTIELTVAAPAPKTVTDIKDIAPKTGDAPIAGGEKYILPDVAANEEYTVTIGGQPAPTGTIAKNSDGKWELTLPAAGSAAQEVVVTGPGTGNTVTVTVPQKTALGVVNANGFSAPKGIYDLRGRKLQAAPEHGLYIQDGRLRLRK